MASFDNLIMVLFYKLYLSNKLDKLMHMSHAREFTLGIYGDGQLARLLALRAREKNISLLIFTLNSKDSPCRDLAPLHEGPSWKDQTSFEAFSERCESVVLENEFVPVALLLEAQNKGARCFPDALSFDQVSNKLKQVTLANQLGIHVPEFKVIHSETDLKEVALPSMLKCLSGGYDGYGNFTYTSLDQWEEAQEFITQHGPVLAQEFIFYEQEVAVVIAGDGEDYFSFPVVETIQEKNICHFVLTPPRLKLEIQNKVKAEALKIIKAINGKGVFGVEFFIRGEEVIFNEIAPRTHNSGHFSIEACDYSQFDALIKLITHEKLTQPELKVPAAGMLNLLGTQNGKAKFKGDDAFEQYSEGFLHLYGKEDSRIGRKMGHFTLLGSDGEALLKDLAHLKMRYEI